jgi:predicted dehydrogenase
LVGCGRIANNHFGAIEGHADSVELVDVCDVNAKPWPKPFPAPKPMVTAI